MINILQIPFHPENATGPHYSDIGLSNVSVFDGNVANHWPNQCFLAILSYIFTQCVPCRSPVDSQPIRVSVLFCSLLFQRGLVGGVAGGTGSGGGTGGPRLCVLQVLLQKQVSLME